MEQFGFEPKKDDVSDVLFALAVKNTFNPVVEYLDGLAWDGTPRVDGLLPRYFGAADGAYERAVGRKLMLAAVRRARHPGTKFDTVPILEGKQGSGKAATDFERVAKNQGLDLDYDRASRIREITELPAEDIGGSIDELARLLGQTDPNKGNW